MRQAYGNVDDWTLRYCSLRLGRHIDRRRGMPHPRHLTCLVYQSGRPSEQGFGTRELSERARSHRQQENTKKDVHHVHQQQASFSGLVAEMPEVDTSASCRDSWASHPGKEHNRV